MKRDEKKTQYKPCSICGQPTRSKYGVCIRSTKCRREWNRRMSKERMRQYVGRDKYPCLICGRPTWSKYRICRRSPDCRRAHDRQRSRLTDAEKENRGWRPCLICGNLTVSRIQVCTRSAECLRANYRIRKRIHARESGIPSQKMLTKQRHPGWSGGKYAYCVICGVPIGWCNGTRVRQNKVGFFCKKHRGLQSKVGKEQRDERKRQEADGRAQVAG